MLIKWITLHLPPSRVSFPFLTIKMISQKPTKRKKPGTYAQCSPPSEQCPLENAGDNMSPTCHSVVTKIHWNQPNTKLLCKFQRPIKSVVNTQRQSAVIRQLSATLILNNQQLHFQIKPLLDLMVWELFLEGSER